MVIYNNKIENENTYVTLSNVHKRQLRYEGNYYTSEFHNRFH